MTELDDFFLELQQNVLLYGCAWYWRCCQNRDAHRHEFYYSKKENGIGRDVGVGRFYCAICERLNRSVAS